MHLPIKKGSLNVSGNAEDADTGGSGSLIAPTKINSSGSSSPSTETNNASSSSTAPTGNHYEVFLSFRGTDTREGFTDHLYKGLVDAGICVFRDDEELRQGEEIGPHLSAAIKNSKILIPILSMNYGSSKWCLDELVQIMECKNDNAGTIVLPIFYKVKPADVRHQIGKFGDAFRTREKRFDQTTLEKWKQTLKEVGNLKGWEAIGYEGELVKLVVQKVLSELKKEFELDIPENLVGIGSHVKNVMEFVDNNSCGTLFVGIHGMGGIGKTTLAKTIYNKLSNQFEYCSVIADIRELCKRNGLEYLQNQLIFHLLKRKDQVRNKDEGTKFISSKFKGKKVLILLDDVDDVNQLKGLAGNHDWFSSGSRIIITTRNKRILDKVGVDYNYEHEKMDIDQSLILFSRHAFRRDSPPNEFKDLTHEVVSTTGGLPLSLEVLGSLLCGQEQKLWSGTINKLRKVPHIDVQKSLRISFEALEYEQQQIFLDIACFFIGTDWRIASYMWDTCEFFPVEGIDVLRFMSLIKVGDNQELRMHDQLRDLGRAVVREENQQEPCYRSRIWDSKEALNLLKRNKGTEKIKAICLSKDNSEGSGETADQGDDILTGEQFKNLTSLRFLDVNGAHFSGDFKNSMEELKWLRWQNCPLTFEAKNFHIKELVALDLSKSKISSNWRGWSSIMVAEKLKFLDLTRCRYLVGTLFLSAFKNLEVLILKDCRILEQIDSSIGDMKSLVRLDLTGCWTLKELPAEVDKLQALEILNISSSGIKELPNGIGRLKKLRDFNASGCRKLGGEMPESFRNLSSLQHLDFEGCRELQSLPDLPSSLAYLSVTCQSSKLPSLSHLNHLRELHVIGWEFLKCIRELPSTSERSQLTDVEESKLQKSLNNSFKLEILEIRGCTFMETLDVSQLNHLRALSAERCDKILEVGGLEKLKYLESLTITGCTSIEKLDLPKSDGMKKLHAKDCKSLVEIQGIDRLESLEELCITWCASIERLDLPKFKCLKILNTEYCEKLVEIQGLDKLEFLEKLYISQCTSIKRIDLPKSGNLNILYAEECEELVEIQGLDRLEFLVELHIFGCASIERLDLPKSNGLKKLYAQNCTSLIEIQGLDGLDFLVELYISGSALIERLDLPKFKSLKILKAQNCENLVEIQGLNRLELLVELYIFRCTSIKTLDLPKSEGLNILSVQDCENLVEIQGLDKLEFLKVLNISGCTLIERLDLSKSECMKRLATRCCKSLVEIQGLDRMEFLEVLNVSECPLIEKLDLRKLKDLKELYAENCKSLVEIQGLDRLEFLKELNIFRCTSIKRMDLPKSDDLKKLCAGFCIAKT